VRPVWLLFGRSLAYTYIEINKKGGRGEGGRRGRKGREEREEREKRREREQGGTCQLPSRKIKPH
jgi:hypothetical protein